MLQARQWICILLLAASAVPAAHLYAQNDEPAGSEREFERLGDGPVNDELELQLTVPMRDAAPAPVQEPVQEPATREQLIERNLAAAAAAMQAGRIDQPLQNCAWTYFRAVLDLDPENAIAQQGLVEVQKVLVARAVKVASELDFESASRMLEDAALVRESRELIDQGEEDIAALKLMHVETLETKAVLAMDGGDFAQAERVLVELIAIGDADSTVNQLRRRLEEARSYGGFKPGQVIRDHFINQGFWTPESVVVLAGSYIMGSSAFEDGRQDNEGPTHRVTFRRGFAIGRTEVTVREFRMFVDKTGYHTDAEKQRYSMVYNHHSGRLTKRERVSWENNYEGEEAKEDEPVVHVSWNDANAYVQWLARGTGKAYRLPSEAEFEYAVRGGRATRFWWGDGTPAKVVENLTGEEDLSPGRRQWSSFFADYSDGFWGPAPVASFETNPFGLYDIAGNVGEWVSDCWHDSYLRAPADGSAWINPGCKSRVIRGGYWASSPDQARSAYRTQAKPDRRDALIGFRIARDL